MEAYKTTCPDCGHVRFWVGYKTGIGKTAEQLKQMEKDHKTCVKCGSEKAMTDLDSESPTGQAMSEATQGFLSALASALSDPKK
jgi:hypothetical protein